MEGKTYREDLPAHCPPAAAQEVPYNGACRFICSAKPKQKHFDSHAAKGKRRPPTVPPCVWASCSFFVDKKVAYAKLPKIRATVTHLAVLDINAGDGVSLEKNGHIDFWMYRETDPVNAIQYVEAVNDD